MSERKQSSNESPARIARLNEARRRVFSGALSPSQRQAFKVAEEANAFLVSFEHRHVADVDDAPIVYAMRDAFEAAMGHVVTGGVDSAHVSQGLPAGS